MIPQSLASLLANRKTLSTPQLNLLVQQLKEYAASQGAGLAIPGDPASFAEKFSGGKWLRTIHLDALNEKLVALESRSTKIPRIIVNEPPRHGKSEFISYWFPLWCLARNPSRKVILISYEAEFAAHWGRRCRDWIRDNGKEIGLILDSVSTAAHRWSLTAGGSMTTAGAGGPITGKGADIIIVDDPIKNDEEASSEIMREQLWSWYQTVPMTRLEPNALGIVCLGTRWHEDDLLGRLEKYSKIQENGERLGLEYDILKLPAIATENDPIGRSPGDALWPERFPISRLQEIRKGMSPYHWSALYQQTPTPEEGNAVKRTWWKYYSELPSQFDVMIQAWDTTFDDMKKADFCVGQVWGRIGASFYLVDQIRDRMNAKDLIAGIKHFQEKYPRALGKIIEASGNGPAIIQVFQKEVPGMIPVKPKGSKDSRLQSVIPLIAAGNVFIPVPEKSSWIGDFIEECAGFPRAQHDDQVDAMVHALRHLQPQAWTHEDRVARQEARDALEPKTIVEMEQKKIHKFFKEALKRKAKEVNRSQRLPR